MLPRGGVSPVSAAKQIAANCHWSLAGVGRQTSSGHSGAGGAHSVLGIRRSGTSTSGTAHCQPSNQMRPIGDAQTVSGVTLPWT